MREGELIVDGAKQDLLTAERLRELFGLPLEVVQRDGFYHVW
jgi:iron complex transport system ATP-binding protein